MRLNLKFLAFNFLRFEKACAVALEERTPRGCNGQPDVLGVTKHRYLLEIEVKHSVSDFKANAKKTFHAVRDGKYPECEWFNSSKFPKQFWFLVPAELAEKCLPITPAWAGLMRNTIVGERGYVVVIKDAPINAASKRLTTKECVKLANCMANQILAHVRRSKDDYLDLEHGAGI
jgi:hypothetical protein